MRRGGSLDVYSRPGSGLICFFRRRLSLTLPLVMLSSTTRALVTALVLVTVFAAGCDTSDPVEPADPADVAGTYDITEFRFIPDRSGIVPVNVLDSLAAEASYLDLRSSGNFQLVYQFTGDDFSDDARGAFTVTPDKVRLNARDMDVARMQALLLSQNVTLERASDTVLSIDEQMTVDLEAYDDDVYGGIEPQPGRLRVQFTLQPDLE